MGSKTVQNRLSEARKPDIDWVGQSLLGRVKEHSIQPTSEAWEASVLPLNYARSLFLIVLTN
jgi:hypothetical protein